MNKFLIFAIAALLPLQLQGQDTLSFRDFRIGMSSGQVHKITDEKFLIYGLHGQFVQNVPPDGSISLEPVSYRFGDSAKFERYMTIAQLAGGKKVVLENIDLTLVQNVVSEIRITTKKNEVESIDKESLSVWIKATIEACSSKYGKPTENQRDFSVTLNDMQIAARWRLKDGNEVIVGVFKDTFKTQNTSTDKYFGALVLHNVKLMTNEKDASKPVISASGL